MIEPKNDGPKSRENLREVLIAGFESDAGLPSERQARQQRRRGPAAITSVRFGGAESFFVGVFAGVSGGTAAGYYGVVFLEVARKSVHDSITWLLPLPVQPALYIVGGFVGAIIGTYVGCVMLAPWLETRRFRGKRFDGARR